MNFPQMPKSSFFTILLEEAAQLLYALTVTRTVQRGACAMKVPYQNSISETQIIYWRQQKPLLQSVTKFVPLFRLTLTVRTIGALERVYDNPKESIRVRWPRQSQGNGREEAASNLLSFSYLTAVQDCWGIKKVNIEGASVILQYFDFWILPLLNKNIVNYSPFWVPRIHFEFLF